MRIPHIIKRLFKPNNEIDYVSDTWWHFTGYRKLDDTAFDHLKEILRSKKIKSRTSEIALTHQTDFGSSPTDSKIFMEGPRACLADIPFNCLKWHAKRYGCFGIGLMRSALREMREDLQINPVLYTDYWLQNSICSELISESNSSDLDKHLRPFIKVIDIQDTFLDIYREREWRSRKDIPVNSDTVHCIIVPRLYFTKIIDLLKNLCMQDIKVMIWEENFGKIKAEQSTERLIS